MSSQTQTQEAAMNQPETNTTTEPRVCVVCGITNQGHRIDFATHCGLTAEWRYAVCNNCEDELSDFRCTVVEMIELRERQMHRNRTSYARRPASPASKKVAQWRDLL